MSNLFFALYSIPYTCLSGSPMCSVVSEVDDSSSTPTQIILRWERELINTDILWGPGWLLREIFLLYVCQGDLEEDCHQDSREREHGHKIWNISNGIISGISSGATGVFMNMFQIFHTYILYIYHLYLYNVYKYILYICQIFELQHHIKLIP